MRLICPKCDAQYNVADDAIPKGGRDVQCSTCGHTWFQTEMSRVLSRPVSRVLSRPIPTAVKSEATEPKNEASRDVGAYDVPHQHKDKSQTHEPKHRPVDANIANILREEASREHDVPARESEKYSSKLPERKAAPAVDLKATRERIAQMTDAEGGTRSKTTSSSAATAVAAPATANPRTIPDINEVNAVLRARDQNNSNAGITEADRVDAARRRGFRRGFLIVVALFVVIITPYVLAEQIIENLPQSRETMIRYVAVMNELRASLNVFVGSIVESVRALIAQVQP
ncbi:zinc-ribbon domain-containing protein [Yoonia litorea]|uniref:MJ0042 family finger-like domain-containing protein n=1 Tax=Yoonia litorea TaxID=1123755 RepID=A0A1I6L466_9RHOB|nr:zinc-ribbon domain-containing protein [Yoonia litorea]SFR98050.1 MJ0042 family finger-like domain-containing protein [Yoonia litorea]